LLEAPAVLTRLFRTDRRKRLVAELYGLIVAQARLAPFYADLGVPDTLEGRFEVIALHNWLVMRRLGRGGADEVAFSQALFDFFFADMDLALREIGVGDLSVGKKIKDMAQHFYGRVKAYEAALDPGAAADALVAALDRNLYGSTLPEPWQTRVMAGYVRDQEAHLSRFPLERLTAGHVDFLPPPVADGMERTDP